MAITKIHPIKSTLKKALDYIENPAKTDEKMLVSSFACAYETADIEFELLLSQAMQKGNNLAHHLIQSFAPDETTPEQAHEIGRQLADEVLQGKHRRFQPLTFHLPPHVLRLIAPAPAPCFGTGKEYYRRSF